MRLESKGIGTGKVRRGSRYYSSLVVKSDINSTVAATSIALYDHITTLDLEVELIWKKKFSVVQLLFILSRYSGDALFLHGTAYQLWLKGDVFTRGYAARF
ncbi:hypothetical protein CC1G_07931 [Coprinopsis cinerea okayama7|uniref:DUF6533 domain-containing protein n=1 Tax=Coprinopsis cinerea (strain Okayama-7 / 130 / ATCC MYA-4618 / FGSC 9003) TaxID=240176 RepID=A8P6S2_COPC7|nr:hypothetical protein CC1G_07931 [Coprinopsis cinerea okayama7\|eukprot:XP_001839216.2 hypothetical protein CC1G_07931 [Coprinopsis cinerea okayama7\